MSFSAYPSYIIVLFILFILYFVLFGVNTFRHYKFKWLSSKYTKAYQRINKLSPGVKIIKIINFYDDLSSSMCFLCKNTKQQWFKATISYSNNKENLYFVALNLQEVVTLMNPVS